MDKQLKNIINSGEFYNKLNKAIYSCEEFIGLKWRGKYVSEISRVSIDDYSIDHKIHMTLQLYSDYGIGPILYLNEDEIESFIKGKPVYDGSYLIGKGLKAFQKFCKLEV